MVHSSLTVIAATVPRLDRRGIRGSMC